MITRSSRRRLVLYGVRVADRGYFVLGAFVGSLVTLAFWKLSQVLA